MPAGPVFDEVIRVSVDLIKHDEALRKIGADWNLTLAEIKRGIRSVEATEKNAIQEAMRFDESQRKIRIQMYKDEQAEKLRVAKVVHDQIMQLRQQEAEANAATAAPGRTGAPFGGGLRIAAAAAGTFGNFQLASAFYGLERLEMATGLLSKGFTAAGTAGGILLGTISALGLGLGVTMVQANEFNQSLARMSTLMDAGAAGTDEFRFALDRVATSAVLISSTFNMDLVDVVKGFQTALSSGIPTDQLEQFARVAATMSQSLGTGFSESVNLLTSFKDAYKLGVSELSGVTDILFNLVDVGKVNVAELTSSFGRLAPIAASAGVTLKDAASAVAALTRQGVTASQAITAVTRGIEAIVSPSEKAQKKFKALGISFGEAD